MDARCLGIAHESFFAAVGVFGHSYKLLEVHALCIVQSPCFLYVAGMDDVQKALKNRYPNIHPLLFHRCLEKAKSNGELFDMLESMPQEYPVVWDEKSRSWVHTEDLLQAQKSVSQR